MDIQGESTPAIFDPDRVAYYEAAGWRAYYDRKWFRVFSLIVKLNHAEFHIPFPRSLVAAYHIARASRTWAPTIHDEERVRAHLRAFYALACKYAGLTVDAETAGDLEIRYWEVHRRLIDEGDKTEFVESVIELHCALFGLSADEVRESAEQRVLASNLVDGITSQRSTDVEGDWTALEAHLQNCYRSLAAALTHRLSEMSLPQTSVAAAN